MSRLIAALLLGVAVVAFPVAAADSASAPQTSKPTAKKYSMAVNGRFHRVHVKKLELSCGTCHKKEQTDLLVVTNGEPLPKHSPGVVKRSSCLSCHNEGKEPAFYGLTPH
jgi:hypothetical protein